MASRGPGMTSGVGPASVPTDRVPDAVEGVSVTEKPGGAIPLDVPVLDEYGESRLLGSYLKAGKPVVLNLGYYGCPMLCGLVLNGLTQSVAEMGWTPGEEFVIVSLSIDPDETPRLAREKKRNYINVLGQAEAAAGWHFLTADQTVSAAVADAVGFGYRYDPLTSQYVHPAVLVVLMPDGRVSRYLYGIQFPARTLRLSLVEAGEGKVGTTMDRILLTCFEYDPALGGYRVAAMGLMRLGGAVTVVVVAGAIGTALLRERGRRKRESAA
jgi:protein SCO1